MKSLWLLMILSFACASSDLNAQTKQKKSAAKSSKTSKTTPVKKALKTISAGVVNARAIDLVKPEYPKAARAVNTYGQVQVQVLIDENGDVISAKAISGHPLLRFVAVKAAEQSKFNPHTLGGEPVRINGFIHYHFLPAQWNWLEIGHAIKYDSNYYSYYNLRRLLEVFPTGFAEEVQLLQQIVESAESDDQIIETLIASIRGKLIGDKKAAWLFEIGLILREIKYGQNAEDRKKSLEKVETFLLDKPENISPELVLRLEKLIRLFQDSNENDQIYAYFIDFEEKFPFLGR